MITISALIVTLISAPILAAQDAAITVDPANQTYKPKEVARGADDSWSVETLGEGVYLFRWWPGFYVSAFVVGRDDVLAVDPMSREVAALYRQGIAAVTDKPVTKIIYSHDHRDHIVGADVLAPEADIYAHPGTAKSLKRRGDTDIPFPTRLVNDGDLIPVSGRSVSVHYFGPNHGRSNIALGFATSAGSILAYVDTLEIGIVPYRGLPDTDVRGYIESLRAASALNVDWVLGGHSGPGPGIWIDHYLNYLLDLEQALGRASAEIPVPLADTVEDVIVTGDRYTDAIIASAIDELRPIYGTWRGFESWAPMNAETVLMYLITGN
ncbi:MAG: MBL fold metallo-hydrolase [Congregibacter sp.]